MHFGQVNDINFREVPETTASLLFEKREQDRANANKAFFSCWIKVTAEKFLHIWNPESQAGINEKEENQREREPRHCMSLVENWCQRHGVPVKCRLVLINFPELTQWDVRFCNADVSVKCPVALRVLSFNWPKWCVSQMHYNGSLLEQTWYFSFFLHKFTFGLNFLHMKAHKLRQNYPKFLIISQNWHTWKAEFSPCDNFSFFLFNSWYSWRYELCTIFK